MDEQEFKRRCELPRGMPVSRADMISKLGDVEEEADETLHWMEMLIDARLVPASIRTLRRKNPKSKTQNPKSP